MLQLINALYVQLQSLDVQPVLVLLCALLVLPLKFLRLEGQHALLPPLIAELYSQLTIQNAQRVMLGTMFHQDFANFAQPLQVVQPAQMQEFVLPVLLLRFLKLED